MIVVGLLIIFLSCTRKTIPQIPERASTPMSVKTEADLKADPVKGKQVFMEGCKRCHGLPEAGQFNRSRWEAVLPAMIRKAGLNTQEAADIREYINCNLIKS